MAGRRPYAFTTAMLCMGVLLFAGTVPAPLYPIYRERLGFSEIVLTLIFATYFLAALAALLFLGQTSQQLGRRRVLFGAIAAAATSTVTLLVARDVPLLFVGRALSGLSVGWALPAATAYAGEVHGGEDAPVRSAEVSALVQMAGLGAGPLLAGLLAAFAPGPTTLPYLVLLVLLALLAVMLVRAPETVSEKAPLSFRPQIGIGREQRGAFISLGASGFCIFALVGLFTSVAGLVLKQRLGVASHAASGALAFELFLAGIVSEWAVRGRDRDRVLALSLSAVPLGLAVLIGGEVVRSLPLFLLGTGLAGVGIGLGFANTLAALNALASDDERTKLLTSYFTVTYLAAAVPVVGIGVITQLWSALAADICFACVVGLMAAGALMLRLRGYGQG